MRHIKTQRFAKAGAKLPPEAKAQAGKALALLYKDVSHSSLNIERIAGHPGLWSGRISQKLRCTVHFEQDEMTGERVCTHRVIRNHEDACGKPWPNVRHVAGQVVSPRARLADPRRRRCATGSGRGQG